VVFNLIFLNSPSGVGIPVFLFGLVIAIVFFIGSFSAGFICRLIFERFEKKSNGLKILAVILSTYLLIIPSFLAFLGASAFLYLPFIFVNIILRINILHFYLNEMIFSTFFIGFVPFAIGYFLKDVVGFLLHKIQLNKQNLKPVALFAAFFIISLIATFSQSPIILSSIALQQENPFICYAAIGAFYNYNSETDFGRASNGPDICKTNFYYQSAIKHNNASFCEKIETEFVYFTVLERIEKDTCFDEVALKTGEYSLCTSLPCIQAVAIKNLDPSICKEIYNLGIETSLTDAISPCIKTVAIEKKDPSACREIGYDYDPCQNIIDRCQEVTIYKKECLNSLAIKKRTCRDQVTIQKKNCLNQVAETVYYPVLNQAIKEEDVGICNQIVDSVWVETCVLETTIGIAANKGDPSMCEQFSDKDNRDICYQKYAVIKEDISICEKIESGNHQQDCYYYITGDVCFSYEDINTCIEGKIEMLGYDVTFVEINNENWAGSNELYQVKDYILVAINDSEFKPYEGKGTYDIPVDILNKLDVMQEEKLPLKTNYILLRHNNCEEKMVVVLDGDVIYEGISEEVGLTEYVKINDFFKKYC